MMIEKTFCEIIGDITNDGYALKVEGKDVPVLYGKDDTTVYPQIRITPNIDAYPVYFDRFAVPDSSKSVEYSIKVFQVDLYSENKIELEKIKKAVKTRRYYFFNLEYMDFEYTEDFAYDNENGYYFNPIYSDTRDNHYRGVNQVKIGNSVIQKTTSLDKLKKNSWYMNKDGLYIKISDKYDIQDIKIIILLQGRRFKNGDIIKDRRIIDYNITREAQLSDLEDNEVERYSFDMAILFSEEIKNRKLPIIKDINFRYD